MTGEHCHVGMFSTYARALATVAACCVAAAFAADDATRLTVS